MANLLNMDGVGLFGVLFSSLKRLKLTCTCLKSFIPCFSGHEKRLWLKKLIIAKCLCYVLLDVDFMETLVQMVCVRYATKNTFNGRMVVMVELAHQVSVIQQRALN